jgi:hypothetical protein
VSNWHDFAAVLATMPDVIDKLSAEHVPTAEGRCRACTTPGRGTPNARWPCSMAAMAREAIQIRSGSASSAVTNSAPENSTRRPVDVVRVPGGRPPRPEPTRRIIEAR